jgi:2-C-methyl-D-erythritol 4-phosphate cytidylyltransferase
MQDIRKVAIIVAAGSGSRMGGPVPKQFQELGGVPLAIHSGIQFRQFDAGIELIYVVASGTAQIWENLLRIHIPGGNWRLCMGGRTRFESVRNGIRSISEPETLVAIHDGARPFLEPDQIRRGFIQAWEKGNAVFAVPAKDSIRVLQEDGTSTFVDRSQYFYVQTPQIFWQKDLRTVYDQEDDARFTDDATVMEMAGHRIHLVEGSYHNLKVTTPEDWILAARILEKQAERPADS